MPEAHATPSRSLSMSAAASPESAQASIAATIASCAERSRRRALTRSSTSVGSTLTRPAILTGICSAHSSVRWRTPGVPARRPSQEGPGRRRLTDDRGSGLLLLDVPDGVADGLEVLHLVIGDGHAELLLGG